jgi:hypothetical protein
VRTDSTLYKESDPEHVASELVDVDERMSNDTYNSADREFLEQVNDTLGEDYPGLRSYSEDLLSDYRQLEANAHKFEQYRGPTEYASDLFSDVKEVLGNTKYGDTGIEIFSMPDPETPAGKAVLVGSDVLNTNIGREVTVNFIRYKGIAPFSDVAGGLYGLAVGTKHEIKDTDVAERMKDIYSEMT